VYLSSVYLFDGGVVVVGGVGVVWYGMGVKW